MLRRILLIAGVALAGLMLFAVILASVAQPLMRYFSRVQDPVLAKRNGEALSRLHGQTIVSVIGHPDDAEYYTGGTLAMLARHGNRVVVIAGTSGEKGGNGSIPNLGRVREGEQRAAAKIGGYSRVVFARNPDRGLADDAHFRAQLLKVFEEENPSVLITFDAEREAWGYRHPDHFYAGEAALQVARKFPSFRTAYLFSTSAPNVTVDVNAYADIKSRARAAHVSQHQGRSGILAVLGFLRFGRGGSHDETRTGSAPANREGDFGGGTESYRLVRLRR